MKGYFFTKVATAIFLNLPVLTYSWFPGLTKQDQNTNLCQHAQWYTAGQTVGKDGNPPFEIVANKSTYLSGRTIEVEIKLKPEMTAKRIRIQGVIIQAREIGKPAATSPKMNPVKDGKTIGCYNPNDTLFVWKAQPTRSIKVLWTAPHDSGPLQFVASVFENPQTAWMNITSSSIAKGFDPIDLSTCGTRKGCFRYNCQNPQVPTTCDYVFTYRTFSDHESVEFELSAEADWVAIGFSSDRKMGGDDVLMCEIDSRGDVGEINHYRNNNNYIKPTKSANNPTFNHQSEMKDGRLSCRFNRSLTVHQDDYSVDLNNDWYHLYAWGSKSNGGLLNRHTLASPPTSEYKNALFHLINVTSASTYIMTSQLIITAMVSLSYLL